MKDGKIIDISRGQVDLLEISPQALLPVFNKWRAAEPDKYESLIRIICIDEHIQPQDLLRRGRSNGENYHGRNH